MHTHRWYYSNIIGYMIAAHTLPFLLALGLSDTSATLNKMNLLYTKPAKLYTARGTSHYKTSDRTKAVFLFPLLTAIRKKQNRKMSSNTMNSDDRFG